MTTASTSTPARRPNLLHLGFAVFFAAIGFILCAPTRLDIAIIFREVMHGLGVTSLAAGGFLATATLIGEGLTEMLTGGFSDRWGRMSTLVVGLVVYSIFGILTALSVALPVTYLFRICLGIGQAIFVPAWFAFVGGIHGKRRGVLLGFIGGLFTVGVALNPLLTKDMFQATGHWQTPFIGYGVLGLVLAAVVYLLGRGPSRIFETRYHELPAPPAAHEESRFGWLLNRNMMLLFATMLFWGYAQYGFLGLVVHYLRAQEHFTLGAAVHVAEIAGWTAFAVGIVAGYLSDHIGRRVALIIFGVLGLLAAPWIWVFPQSFLSAAILAAVYESCTGVFFPLGVAYAQDSARADRLGAHTGIVTGVGHFVAGISGLIVGALAASFGWASVGWVFAGVTAVMIVGIALTRDPRRAVAPQLAPATP